jgi:hypothetical protein
MDIIQLPIPIIRIIGEYAKGGRKSNNTFRHMCKIANQYNWLEMQTIFYLCLPYRSSIFRYCNGIFWRYACIYADLDFVKYLYYDYRPNILTCEKNLSSIRIYENRIILFYAFIGAYHHNRKEIMEWMLSNSIITKEHLFNKHSLIDNGSLCFYNYNIKDKQVFLDQLKTKLALTSNEVDVLINLVKK